MAEITFEIDEGSFTGTVGQEIYVGINAYYTYDHANAMGYDVLSRPAGSTVVPTFATDIVGAYESHCTFSIVPDRAGDYVVRFYCYDDQNGVDGSTDYTFTAFAPPRPRERLKLTCPRSRATLIVPTAFAALREGHLLEVSAPGTVDGIVGGSLGLVAPLVVTPPVGSIGAWAVWKRRVVEVIGPDVPSNTAVVDLSAHPIAPGAESPDIKVTLGGGLIPEGLWRIGPGGKSVIIDDVPAAYFGGQWGSRNNDLISVTYPSVDTVGDVVIAPRADSIGMWLTCQYYVPGGSTLPAVYLPIAVAEDADNLISVWLTTYQNQLEGVPGRNEAAPNGLLSGDRRTVFLTLPTWPLDMVVKVRYRAEGGWDTTAPRWTLIGGSTDPGTRISIVRFPEPLMAGGEALLYAESSLATGSATGPYTVRPDQFVVSPDRLTATFAFPHIDAPTPDQCWGYPQHWLDGSGNLTVGPVYDVFNVHYPFLA